MAVGAPLHEPLADSQQVLQLVRGHNVLRKVRGCAMGDGTLGNDNVDGMGNGTTVATDNGTVSGEAADALVK